MVDKPLPQGHLVVPADDVLEKMTTLFKVFGDQTRVRILYTLFEEELPVSAIVALLAKSQSSISHQLHILKQAGLVKNRREGKIIFYSLADKHVITIFGQMIQHVTEK
ncbi:ArsR/SmtB family transcription factor [Loigolactobacillus backii]|uniref:Transcriptional regulator n=1 Tax=Loigolactobacillus backii TaxID=375175 RepID=A0A192H354_9LACO|nr:metalloregulator ArsR/SmtB family transcription factor [Loigolactobacillus backii]ANK59244.1 transcriptional regulator [Loigolactobacillus backii]ANK62657.1 transcriptional regulator [Loigolactobacillus backii]ANK64235.1 transcriptional regulator [Loigolactobacillus backii]ANK67371.1 transcriptional regulator [Loigolactobacillus backii]ANK70335.1 transcriptional regulator [Loigolactobacillus backii]